MNPNTDLRKVLTKEHERKWVALSADRSHIIDYADNLSQLRQKLNERDDVVYLKVLPSDTIFAF